MRVYIQPRTKEKGTLEMNYCLTLCVREKSGESVVIQQSVTRVIKKADTIYIYIYIYILDRITLQLKVQQNFKDTNMHKR